MRRCGPFATTSRTKETLSCTTLLIKWLSDVQRNGFVGSNSRMNTDRPKPASRHIIRPNVDKISSCILVLYHHYMLSRMLLHGTVVIMQYITNLTKRWIFAVLDVQFVAYNRFINFVFLHLSIYVPYVVLCHRQHMSTSTSWLTSVCAVPPSLLHVECRLRESSLP